MIVLSEEGLSNIAYHRPALPWQTDNSAPPLPPPQPTFPPLKLPKKNKKVLSNDEYEECVIVCAEVSAIGVRES